MADFNGDMRKTLYQDHMEEPRAIAVYPSEGWMFWTDWGQNAMIERGGMDGRFREVGCLRCFFLKVREIGSLIYLSGKHSELKRFHFHHYIVIFPESFHFLLLFKAFSLFVWY